MTRNSIRDGWVAFLQTLLRLADSPADRRRVEPVDPELLELRVAQRTEELEKINHALSQDHARFAVAARAAGFGFWSFEVATGEFHWDELMCGLYGLEPAAMHVPYTTWAGLLHPDDRSKAEMEMHGALAGDASFDTEFRIVQRGGQVKCLRAAAHVTRDANHRTTHLFGVNFDISERRRATEQLRLAIDAAPTGMLMMNPAGSIVMANAQIEVLFGYRRDELLGQPIEMLVPKRFRAHHPEFRRSFFSAPQSRPMGAGRDLYGLRKDGSEMPVEIGLNPIHTVEGEFVLSSIIDLTHRREIDRMRSEFVSTVSHELRSPLTSINGSLGLLHNGAVGPLPDKAISLIRIAYLNSERLARIINDILDFGSLEAGRLALNMIRVRLADLLRQTIESNLIYAERYGVSFQLDVQSGEQEVIADPDRLTQVLTNLLTNAVKFSVRGGNVLVRLRAGAATAVVEVQDFGTGIAEEFKGRIFEKFAQADSSAARPHEGTGLGLSIARKLVETMGGSIGFTSVVGQGTTFYFELPRAPGACAPAASASA